MLKRIAKIAAISAGCALVITLLFSSIFKTMKQLPTAEEIREPTSVSKLLPEIEQNTLKTSRLSAVRVLSIDEDGGISTSTGTYFTLGGAYYILTVNHGLTGPCSVIRIWTETEGFAPCKEIVLFDPVIDYAVIQVEEISSMEPIELPSDMPRARAWKSALSSQTKVYHTGYPNNTGPLTLDGTIIGYADGNYVYINSFAWAGSSGSGVFTSQGEFIGYIMAIDIGQTEHGVDVLENLVIVVPAFMVNWTTLSKQNRVIYDLFKRGKKIYEKSR